MDDDKALIPTVVAPPPLMRLVALKADDMQRCQSSLIAWCDQKIAFDQQCAMELQENYDIATKNKWRKSTIKKHLELALESVTFYGKIKAAIQAGYTIIPNFPCDVFAVRIAEDTEPAMDVWTNRWNRHPPRTISPDALPSGEGDNVSNVVPCYNWSEENDGKVIHKSRPIGHFGQINFPFQLAKTAILNATAEALALKVFDQVAAAPARRRQDPMIIGQVLRKSAMHEPISFLIAWFLDSTMI